MQSRHILNSFGILFENHNSIYFLHILAHDINVQGWEMLALEKPRKALERPFCIKSFVDTLLDCMFWTSVMENI